VGNNRLNYQQGKEIFLISKTSRPALEPISILFSGYWGDSLPRGKVVEALSKPLTPSRVQVKIE
jgi:hypothetical protein